MTFQLETDASDYGMGAVLTQNNKLIGIFSGKYNSSRQNYTVVEKEMLAIIEALTHFKRIVFGCHVTIKTDSANLIHDCEINSTRFQRWKLLLLEFDYELQHLSGTNNTAADTLSRLLTISTETLNNKILKLTSVAQSNIDREMIIKNKWETENTSHRNFIVDVNKKVIIPEIETQRFIHNLLLFLGHPGAQTLYNTLKNYFYIPKIKTTIEKLTKACKSCQTNWS